MRRKKIMRVKDVIDLTTGLFQHIENPLWNDRYEPFDMDLEFLTTYGEKKISPLVKYFVKDGKVDEEGAKHIINLIYRKYKDGWKRQYEVLDVSYEILDNYFMVETEEIDRDTLEKNIRDLLRTNSETKTQINDLLEKIDRSEQNSIDRTGSDVETIGEERNINSENNVLSDVRRNEDKIDILSFNDRQDIESRDLEKSSLTTETIDSNKTNTLEFVNRKDITQSSRDLTNTDSGTKSTEVNNEEIDTESGTRIVTTGEEFDSVTNETETGTTLNDNKSSLYGFNSITPTPSNEGEGTQEVNSNKNNSTTSNKDTSSNEEIDITNSKTFQGSEVDTHSNNITELEQNQGETSKSGKEITSQDENANNQTEIIDTDIGTVSNSKTGSEITNTTVNGGEVTTESNDSTSNETANINRSGEYSNKDTATSETINERTNTGSVNTDSELTGNEKETIDTTGELNEARTLERRGNLGVTTTSKILQEHIEFWKFNFLDQVYKDVSEMMTLKIY